MAEPHRFSEAMNYSFVSLVFCVGAIHLNSTLTQGFATAVYAIIGIAGYLMFGDNVYDEVTTLFLPSIHVSDIG